MEEPLLDNKNQKQKKLHFSWFETYLTFVVFLLFLALYHKDNQLQEIQDSLKCTYIRSGYFKRNKRIQISQNTTKVFFEDMRDKQIFDQISDSTFNTQLITKKLRSNNQPNCFIIFT